MISPTKNKPHRKSQKTRLHLLAVFALKGALPRCRLRRDDVRMDYSFLGCLVRRGRFFFPKPESFTVYTSGKNKKQQFFAPENRGKAPNNEMNIQTSWIFRCYVVSFRFRVTVRGGVSTTRGRCAHWFRGKMWCHEEKDGMELYP